MEKLVETTSRLVEVIRAKDEDIRKLVDDNRTRRTNFKISYARRCQMI